MIDLLFSVAGEHAFAACSDGNIFVIHVPTRVIEGALKQHTSSVNALALSENGQFLISASSDSTAAMYETL